jgi:addiction module RelE/StbE family toxin
MANGYYLQTSKIARKIMAKIPLPWSERLARTIGRLLVDPYLGEKMSGELSGCRKIRVWPYRIIYRLDKKVKTIIILEVNHRGSVSYD